MPDTLYQIIVNDLVDYADELIFKFKDNNDEETHETIIKLLDDMTDFINTVSIGLENFESIKSLRDNFYQYQ